MLPSGRQAEHVARRQTDRHTETRRDTSVTTLRWVKSPGPTNSFHTSDRRAVTTGLLVTAWRTSSCEGLRMEDRPRRGALIYELQSRWRHTRPRSVHVLPACRIGLPPPCLLGAPHSSSSQCLFPRLLTAAIGPMTYHPQKTSHCSPSLWSQVSLLACFTCFFCFFFYKLSLGEMLVSGGNAIEESNLSMSCIYQTF